MENFFSDDYFMKQALKQARIAFDKGEVPVGAIVVFKNQIISKAHNLSEALNDSTAHAEMQAITSAGNLLGNKYLKGCTLYVTIEPCVMCAGALQWSQISRIVYGADDRKKGYRKFNSQIIHPNTEIKGTVLEPECSAIMSDFFLKIR